MGAITHGPYRFTQKEHGVLELRTSHDLKVMAIPDLHCPYQHPRAFEFIQWALDTHQPDIVVCLGDEAEFAALGVHDKNPDAPSSKDEYIHALAALGDLYKIVPEAMCCVSNHTSRPYRTAFSASIPSMMMKSYKELLQAPQGWHWSQRIVINDVVYIHGDPKSGKNAHISWMNDHRMSTVIGHIHGHGGVYTSMSPFRKAFAMNAGCLVDTEALAFEYGKKYANKATLGIGIIHSSTDAEFIPMERWLKTL